MDVGKEKGQAANALGRLPRNVITCNLLVGALYGTVRCSPMGVVATF